MKRNNCPNCGAPIEPYVCKCKYCGTYYFDLAAFNFEDGKPVFVKFKVAQGNVTALAIPNLETIEVSSESSYACDGKGATLMRYTSSRTCDVNVNFRCIQNPESGELFRLEISRDWK